MKICPSCKKLIPDDSEVCSYCLQVFEAEKLDWEVLQEPKRVFGHALASSSGSTREQTAIKRLKVKGVLVIIIIVVVLIVGYVCFKNSASNNSDLSTIGPVLVDEMEQLL